MLTGHNTDLKVKGEIYHIQTEDGGINNPVITTLLYSKGAILASKKISYADIIKVDRMEEVVKGLMDEQHKRMIKELKEGKFRKFTENTARSNAKTEVKDVRSEPKKETKKDKSLDDMILEYLSRGE